MRRLALIGAMIVAATAVVRADSGTQIPWTAVDGGGAVASASANYRLGGTLGQPETTAVNGADAVLVGGFWAIARRVAASGAPTPTATPTAATVTPAASATTTASPTASPTASAPTPTQTGAPPHSPSPSPTRSASPLASPSASPTATAIPGGFCAGDCHGDGQVTVDEVITMVNVALGLLPVAQCPNGDVDADSRITIDELLLAVLHSLNGCPVPSPVAAG